MSAYLYTWNPDRWEWVDQIQAIFRIGNGEPYDTYWSCGNTKKIVAGDVFFLMKLGGAPCGIIGCGYILSAPYPRLHWDAAKARQGRSAPRTDLLFTALSENPILAIERLKARYPAHHWTPQSSGTAIPEPIAGELFAEIQQSPNFGFPIQTEAAVRLYAEGKCREITAKTYDRSTHARQECVKNHGYRCAACGFDFGSVYGALGKNFIEVHHLKPIADIGQNYDIDPVRDLRPVCANCHRMLHRQKPPLAIEDLRTCLQDAERERIGAKRRASH
jgi:5-methylcytosine-specific restriction protein A